MAPGDSPNKVYDGTTAARVTASVSTFFDDDVAVSYRTAVFTDKNVGHGKI